LLTNTIGIVILQLHFYIFMATC